ncbi:Maf family nucleotide pyrophosphatase [Lunatibacter salilacus]|uniref:Maf family nucleotide pyrophosphatase n=1 Tax=Lunatibacter salilacus TaxID=2483804 RepID=UPI00131E24CF|nr:Maf family nucleotide pyrophosphatase [Lunatibacter salilacus]
MAENPIYQADKPHKKIILGSQSPRRSELLKVLDIPFSIRTQEVAEDFPSDLPHSSVAGYLAKKKGLAFLPTLAPDELVITADTVVVADNHLLNKPATAEEAYSMLSLLSGKKHKVITAVYMMDQHKQVLIEDAAWVYFNALSPSEIAYYIETYHPFDKAGGYGIQEWIGYVAIEKIEGSFYTVMGLPIHRVYKELSQW